MTVSPKPEAPWSDSIEARDEKAAVIIYGYALGSLGAMVAVPLPGVDMAATYAVWGKMIYDLARVYGQEPELKDAQELGADLMGGVILVTAAWFASAKTATTFLKFIPGAGTVTAYLIDAVIAGLGARKITTALGLAAAAYYKSGRTIEKKQLIPEVTRVLKEPAVLLTLLAAIAPVDAPDSIDKIA
jgi:uncharacterized protein (DUF697 family)